MENDYFRNVDSAVGPTGTYRNEAGAGLDSSVRCTAPYILYWRVNTVHTHTPTRVHTQQRNKYPRYIPGNIRYHMLVLLYLPVSSHAAKQQAIVTKNYQGPLLDPLLLLPRCFLPPPWGEFREDVREKVRESRPYVVVCEHACVCVCALCLHANTK